MVDSTTRRLMIALIVFAALAAPAQLLADSGDPSGATGATGPATTTPAPPNPQPSSNGGGNGGQSDTNPGSGEQVANTGGSPGTRSRKASTTAGAASSASVSMGDFFFSPRSVTVSVGDSVSWTNAGQAPHNATGDGISTGTLDPGQSASHTFTSAGSFSYICTIHPQMTGTVTVQGGSAGGGGGGGGGDTAGAAPAGSGLPNTGEDALVLAGIGALMLGVGVLLRRRVR